MSQTNVDFTTSSPTRSLRVEPARSRKYLDWIRLQRCAVSGAFRPEAAHTGDRGLGQKASDFNAIPLSAEWHRTGKTAHHAGARLFEQRTGLCLGELILSLNAEYADRFGPLFGALDAGYRRKYRHLIETDREHFERVIGTHPERIAGIDWRSYEPLWARTQGISLTTEAAGSHLTDAPFC